MILLIRVSYWLPSLSESREQHPGLAWITWIAITLPTEA